MNNWQRIGLPEWLRNGCVLYIPGDVSGTTAFDASGSGNNGTLVNSPTVTRGGLWGYKGFGFNNNSYLTVPHNSAFNLTAQFSIFTLFKTSASGEDYFTTKGDDSWYFGISRSWTSAWTTSFYLNWTSGWWADASGTWNDWRWHSVVATWNWNTKIYIDWVERCNVSRPWTPGTGTSQVYVGYRGWVPPYLFDWQMANFGIMNRALSADEVRMLHEAFFTP